MEWVNVMKKIGYDSNLVGVGRSLGRFFWGVKCGLKVNYK